MRVQKTNNQQQSFGMAWQVKLKGMNAQDIRVITNKMSLLDETFNNIDAVISKRFFNRIKGTSCPINRATTRRFGLGLNTTNYVFDLSEAYKSFRAEIKNFFGKGLIIRDSSTDITGIDSEKVLGGIFESAVIDAKAAYLENAKVQAKAAAETGKLPQKLTKEEETDREKAIREFNIKIARRSQHYKL